MYGKKIVQVCCHMPISFQMISIGSFYVEATIQTKHRETSSTPATSMFGHIVFHIQSITTLIDTPFVNLISVTTYNYTQRRPVPRTPSLVDKQFLCRLRSIAAHRNNFVWRMPVCPSILPNV